MGYPIGETFELQSRYIVKECEKIVKYVCIIISLAYNDR